MSPIIPTLPPPGVPVHRNPPRLSRSNPAPARIVVPYTTLHKDTRAALEPYGDRVQYVDVSGDEGAFWCLFRDLWAAGEDVILIEHDIVVRPATIDHFDRCPQSWCSCSYTWRWKPAYHWLTDRSTKVLNASLGCVRFRAELLADCPELGSDDVLEDVVEGLPPGVPLPWSFVDSVFLAVMYGRRRYAVCEHERVGHRQ